MLRLKDAIELYKKEKGAISNSYDWYRKCAALKGHIYIGELSVRAFKQKGIWYIDEIDFDKSIKLHRLSEQKIKQNTIDYNNNNIHGRMDRIQTDWGYYINHGDFHLAIKFVEVERFKNYGVWICNNCNTVAQLEHKNDQCHLCSDWNGCGRDCTLSLVYCNKCKTKLKI